MRAWLAARRADIAALRAAWGSVHGGWSAAWRDAAELLAHRRVMVDTPAMTPDGMRVVLRTRLRLSGDTETDILRGWIEEATGETVESLAKTHFQAVAAAAGGWAAALGMVRLGTQFTVAAGSVTSAVAAIRPLWSLRPGQPIHALLADWTVLYGIALALFGVLIRWILRLRLRAIFRNGLLGPPNPQ
jgi:hypothetical protein